MIAVLLIALVSVVTGGSCLFGAAGVNHPSNRLVRCCIPESEFRPAPFARLRCPTLAQPAGLRTG